jgi:hypothetical protein
MNCGGQIAAPNPAVVSMAVPSQFMSNMPVFIAQAVPHSSFGKIDAMLPWFAGMGCDAIHISPIHPPSQVVIEGKVGSIYAPQDHMRVAPYLYDGGLDPRRWLAGDYVDRYADAEEGWRALRQLTGRARKYGLKVVGDLVLGHTARDPDAIRHHVSLLGPDFYRRREDGGIAFEGAEIDGRWDDWRDTAAIDHSRPQAIEYMTAVVTKQIEAGISVFRADSAGKIHPDIWRQVIAGARTFAAANGKDTPRLYAEVFKDQVDYLAAGFDGVISLYRWDPLCPIKYENAEYVRQAGGAGVLYPDNHDVERLASYLLENDQAIYSRLALLAFLTSSFMFLEGTTHLETAKPSVFLGRAGDAVRRFDDPERADPTMVDLLKTLAAIKMKYPVFHTLAHTRIEGADTRLFEIRRVVPFVDGGGEEALIVFNQTGHGMAFNIPPDFEVGRHVFWTNHKRFEHPDERLVTADYYIPAGGVSLFVRRFDDIDSLGFRIPGYN